MFVGSTRLEGWRLSRNLSERIYPDLVIGFDAGALIGIKKARLAVSGMS